MRKNGIKNVVTTGKTEGKKIKGKTKNDVYQKSIG